jgi:hypothetical protein
MKKIVLMASAAAMCLIGTATSAQVVSYTDKATFLAAAGSTQTETFSSAPVGSFASSGGVFNSAFDGFTVTGNNFGNYVGIATGPTSSSGPNTTIPANFTGQNYLTWANITGNVITLTINFNQATTAFGFDWFNTDVTDQYNVAVTGSGNFSGPPFTVVPGSSSVGTNGFFGLISTTPFTTATITNNFFGGYISDEGMDNFITNGVGSANPGAVPEPATWAMMIFGFGVTGSAMRRRRSAKPALATA